MDLNQSLESQAYQGEERTINIGGVRLPFKATMAVIITCLLIMIDYYYDFLNEFLDSPILGTRLFYNSIDRVFLYLIVPLLVIVLVFRENPAKYGFRIGNWRAGLVITAVGWLIVTPVLYFAVKMSGVSQYYAIYEQPASQMLLMAVFDLIGWEFMFRGFLLFALYRVAGPSALVLQAMPFALGHLGKPDIETISTIFTGVGFGWTAWRTNSFLYAFLIHLYILTFTTIAINGL